MFVPGNGLACRSRFERGSLLGRFEGEAIFAFFATMMMLQLLFVMFVMPEIKGRSLEYLAERLSAHEPPGADQDGR